MKSAPKAVQPLVQVVLVGGVIFCCAVITWIASLTAQRGAGQQLPPKEAAPAESGGDGVAAQITSRSGGTLSASELFTKASPSVVRIDVADRAGRPLSRGSGFIVSEDGLIATNHHVIAGGYTARVVFGDGSTCSVAAVKGLDPESDLAILKTKRSDSPALCLGTNDLPTIGTKVYAIGTPLGVLTNTLSEGLVSGHRKLDDTLSLVQTTAPISPGSSGGPLLTEDGKVAGMTSSAILHGQNLNFGIPAQKIAMLLAAPSKDISLAEAGGQGKWTAEEKRNIAHYFRALRRSNNALAILREHRADLRVIHVNEAIVEFRAGLDEGKAVNEEVLAKAHPDLPATFEKFFIRPIQLRVAGLSLGVVKSTLPVVNVRDKDGRWHLVQQGRPETQSEIHRLESALLDLKSQGESNLNVLLQQWNDWWKANGKGVNFPEEIPIRRGDPLDGFVPKPREGVRFPKFVPE
jgi:hypothetical protein